MYKSVDYIEIFSFQPFFIMNSLHKQLFVLALVVFSCFNFIQCAKNCDYTDEECMTRVATRIYKLLIAGIEGKVNSSDPIYEDEIFGELNAMKYKLSNITMTGLNDCVVKKLVCNTTISVCEYVIRCPKLVITSHYEVNGVMYGIPLDGSGANTITANDYIIIFNNHYSFYDDEHDHKSRILIEYADIDTDLQGKMTFESEGLVGDKEKLLQIQNVANEHYKELEKNIKKPVIGVMMTKYVHNYRDILRTIPKDAITTL